MIMLFIRLTTFMLGICLAILITPWLLGAAFFWLAIVFWAGRTVYIDLNRVHPHDSV